MVPGINDDNRIALEPTPGPTPVISPATAQVEPLHRGAAAVHRQLEWLASPVAYLLIAVVYFRAAWQDPTGRLIGGGNDPMQTMWTLGWPLHALAMGHNPWLTDYLAYPDGVNLMWTPTPLAPGLLLSPITMAWGPIVSYNVLMTLGPPVSAFAASAAIHRLVPHRGAAFLGGLLYGFSPYVMPQELGHLGMVMAWTPPVVLLLLHELLIRRRCPLMLAGTLLGLVAALQLYTSSELLATTALVAVFGLSTLLVVARLTRMPIRPALPALARGGGVALAVGFALGAPGLLTMELGPQVVHGIIQRPDTFVTDVASLVVPDHLMLIAPQQLVKLTGSFTGLEVEWDGYVGLPLLLLLIITAWHWRRRPPVLWASTLAGVVTILSFGPHLHLFGRVFEQPPLPWWPLGQIPTLAQALPSRVMMHFYLLAGLLLAHFVRHAVVAEHRLVVRVPAALLAGLSLLLLAPIATPWVSRRADPAFFSGPAVRRIPHGSVALVAPWAGPVDATAMNWQSAAGYRYRMPEGYAIVPGPGDGVAFDPPPSSTSSALKMIELTDSAPVRDEALRRSMACDLVHWQVRTVVIGPMNHEDEAVATLSWVIGQVPEYVQGVWVWWDVSPACARL